MFLTLDVLAILGLWWAIRRKAKEMTSQKRPINMTRRSILLLLFVFTAAACSPMAGQLMNDTFVNRTLTPEELGSKETRILDVKAYSSTQRCCGLAALWMVMDYWQEGDAGNRQRRLDKQRCPDGGYSVAQLKAMAEAQGFRVFVYQGRPSDLARQLHATRPVIILLRRLGRNHFVVVKGLATKGRLVLGDPSRGTVFIERADLVREWDEVGRPTVLVAPKVGKQD